MGRATADLRERTSSDSPVRKPVVPQHERESTALKHCALSASESQPSATSTPRPPPHEAGPSRRARHARRARGAASSTEVRADAVADSEPPPEPSRAWPQARADATPSPRHVAAISTHARAAALRRSPRSTTERCPIRRSTRPRAAAAPRADALATIRRVSDPRFVDADVEGTDPSFCVYPTFTAPDALDWHPSGPRAERPDAVAAVDATFNTTASQRSARTRAPAGEGGRGASRGCRP